MQCKECSEKLATLVEVRRAAESARSANIRMKMVLAALDKVPEVKVWHVVWTSNTEWKLVDNLGRTVNPNPGTLIVARVKP